MPSVLVTGASRGLGYAFITYFASLPDTTVVGLARNKEATEARLAEDGIKNITILKADVTNIAELKEAADETAKVTGGSLDLLINNAGLVSEKSAWKNLLDFPLPELEEDMTASFQANVIGPANVINTFLPLIRKGKWKKVITISSGMADDSLVNRFSIAIAAPYAISKAATNTLVAKYNAALGKSEGILFMAISPGLVDTREGKPMSEEEIKGGQAMGAQFAKYAPHFTGPITPEESVKLVVDVIHKSTVENMGGEFVSHFGNKQWL